jgi:hypothetical protein
MVEAVLSRTGGTSSIPTNTCRVRRLRTRSTVKPSMANRTRRTAAVVAVSRALLSTPEAFEAPISFV